MLFRSAVKALLRAHLTQARERNGHQHNSQHRHEAGNICIPGSSNEQHIIEDYDVWDFELSEEEMEQMSALEKDDRFADY